MVDPLHDKDLKEHSLGCLMKSLRLIVSRNLKQQTSPAWRRQPETWHFFRDVTAHVVNVVTWRCPEVENARTWPFTSRRKPEYLAFVFIPFSVLVCYFRAESRKSCIMITYMLKPVLWKYPWTHFFLTEKLFFTWPTARKLAFSEDVALIQRNSA